MALKVDKLLIIDFETSGLDASKHQGLSLGAIVVDKNTLEVLDETYFEIPFQSNKYIWSAGAAPFNGMNRFTRLPNWITKTDTIYIGNPVADAGARIFDFIYKHFGGEPVNLCGHNPVFDQKFLEQWLREASCEVKFSHRLIDTNSIGMALFNTNTSNELFELVGVKRSQKHNALEDAKACLKVLQFT